MTDSDLQDRIEAVAAFNRYQAELVIVGDLKWDDGMAELRLVPSGRKDLTLGGAWPVPRTGCGCGLAGQLASTLQPDRSRCGGR
jgi:hypothetical protein